jgi:hypothetical protein
MVPDVTTTEVFRLAGNVTFRNAAANCSEDLEKVPRERGAFYRVAKPFSIELPKLVVRDALAVENRANDGEVADAGRSSTQNSAFEQ